MATVDDATAAADIHSIDPPAYSVCVFLNISFYFTTPRDNRAHKHTSMISGFTKPKWDWLQIL